MAKLNVKILKCAVVFVILAVMAGCRPRADSDSIHKELVDAHCRYIIACPNVPSKSKALAKEVLQKWSDRIIDPEPILIHAGYLKDERKDTCLLLLTMSDEDLDIGGIGIIEEHKDSEGQSIIITE